MGLEHLQQIKAYPNPFFGRHLVSTLIRNPPHQLNAVLLHLLVPILQDGR